MSLHKNSDIAPHVTQWFHSASRKQARITVPPSAQIIVLLRNILRMSSQNLIHEFKSIHELDATNRKFPSERLKLARF
jgi:precorrin-4 methylase